jgi:pyruvate ferredoxin oxidoreductase alpha subunit
VRSSFLGHPDVVHTVIAGLGGRSITKDSLAKVFLSASHGTLAPLTFLDLDHGLVERALARERLTPHSGPVAEGLLRDIGVVAAKIR